MATIDTRGEQVNFSINASVGIYRNYTAYTPAGAIYDLTGKTITTVLKDDCGGGNSYGGPTYSETAYSQTITDAANGEFDFEIPSDAFTNKESGDLTHETYAVLENGKRVGIMWGYISVLERG